MLGGDFDADALKDEAKYCRGANKTKTKGTLVTSTFFCRILISFFGFVGPARVLRPPGHPLGHALTVHVHMLRGYLAWGVRSIRCLKDFHSVRTGQPMAVPALSIDARQAPPQISDF